MSAHSAMAPHDPAGVGAPEHVHPELDAILEDYRRRQMVEHLAGPVVSVLAHMVVLVICFFFLSADRRPTVAEVEVNMEELKITPPDEKIDERLEKIEQETDIVPVMEKPAVETETVTDEVAEAPTDAVDTSTLFDVASFQSPLTLPGIYKGRPGVGGIAGGATAGRGGLGPTEATESALLRALRWLKLTQKPDGSWTGPKGQYPAAMTGLALLAYLGHGETPDSKEFGASVSQAIQYLCTSMDGAGRLLEREYSHAIATYALAEAYGMTSLPYIKKPMEKGLATIVNGQQDAGGWEYNYRKVKSKGEIEGKGELRFDLSVSGWQIQALKAGHIADARVPGLAEALEKSISFLQKQAFNQKTNSFVYATGSSGTISMQGVGALCLQMLGLGKSSEVAAAIKAIEATKVDWNSPRHVGGGHTAYAWYYQTQAMFYAGASKFGPWNRQFSKELVANQKPGPQTPEGKPTGYWEPRPSPEHAVPDYDPLYNTTLCCLMLEVYYRFLPTYKLDLEKHEDKGGGILDLGS
ncbi:MAG: prenyltransferase/squalene oxidase repeat-containing protein [Lentisphaeria bacterium]|jgi:hypothetical protein